MDNSMEIIKQLVDSITSQLTMILMKIEAISPVLDRIHDGILDDTKLDQTTLDMVKNLNSKINDFKDTVTSLPRTIERIEQMEEALNTVKKELTDSFNEVKEKLEPVYEVNSFLAKFKSHLFFWVAVITTAPSVIPAIIVWIKSMVPG